MVVVGFGAAGRAGKASPPAARGAGLFCSGGGGVGLGGACAALLPAVVQEDLDSVAALDEPAVGSDGNAEEEGPALRVLLLLLLLLLPLEPMGSPRRVLCFSFSTLLENRCVGAPPGCEGLAAEALAHPLELDVAPCMPLRPGRLG